MLQFVLNKFELLYVIRLRCLPCLRRMNANYAVDIALEAIVLCRDGYLVRSIFYQQDLPSAIKMMDLICLSLDIAKGCHYLEENHFIHRYADRFVELIWSKVAKGPTTIQRIDLKVVNLSPVRAVTRVCISDKTRPLIVRIFSDRTPKTDGPFILYGAYTVYVMGCKKSHSVYINVTCSGLSHSSI